jgi:hypothetical protein
LLCDGKSTTHSAVIVLFFCRPARIVVAVIKKKAESDFGFNPAKPLIQEVNEQKILAEPEISLTQLVKFTRKADLGLGHFLYSNIPCRLKSRFTQI